MIKQKTLLSAIAVTLSGLLLLQLAVLKTDKDKPGGSVLGLTDSQVSVDTDTEFNYGSFTSTEVSGSGTSAVVQLTGGAANWWDADYMYRRQITITNNSSSTMDAGYTATVTLDSGTTPTAATLYANSLATTPGDDVRIVYDNGSTVELDRDLSVFTNSNIVLAFKIQTQITASNSDNNYYVYYGYDSAANPPVNLGNVYIITGETSPTQITYASGASQIGLATDGTYIYATSGSQLTKVDMTGSVIGTRSVSLGGNNNGLAYSNGRVFGRQGASTLTAYDWDTQVSSSITIPPAKPLLLGSSWDTYNLGSDPQGRILTMQYVSGQPMILRRYTVSGNTLVWLDDITLGGSFQSVDNHGISSDGNYLFFVTYNDGWRRWRLSDGTLEVNFSSTGNSQLHPSGMSNPTFSTYNWGTGETIVGDYNSREFFKYPGGSYSVSPEPTVSLGSETGSLAPVGSWTSASNGNALDLSWNGGWGDGTDGSTAFSATIADVGASSDITFKMRAATTTSGLTGASWITLGTASSGTTFVKTKGDLDGLGVATGDARYVQVSGDFASSDGVSNPKIDSIAINYQADLELPTNPDTLTAKDQSVGSVDLNTNTWYNYPNAYFSWSGAADADSGIAGYYVYFGTNSSADPQSLGAYQTTANYTTSSLSSNSTYFLRIKAVDTAGNVASTTWAPFIYKYDSGLPANPSSVSVIPVGYTSVDSFRFIWTSNGTDPESGVYGYCYKTGTSDGGSPYYTDQCITGNEVNSVPSYQEGENLFYVRSLDNAGNKSSSYISVKYYYNSTPPSEPQNVVVTTATSLSGTTCTSLDNCFEVSWDEPASYSGSIDSYYYAVNEATLDTNNTTQTTTGETTTRTLAGKPLATQQGVNEFKIVAKDNSGVIDYSNLGSAVFVASTTAPGIPTNLLLTDVSNRDNNQYQLTVTWEAPTSVGSGIDHYNVYRSLDGTSYTVIATVSGSSTGYLDTGLTKDQVYYYKITAEDNAASEGSESSVVSGTPTGRYTSPPNIVVNPSVTPSILSAEVAWQMDRECQGYVQLKSNPSSSYTEQGAGTSAVEHDITVVGLLPSTTYYYRVRCEDIDGNEAFSAQDTFVTSGAPSAPTNLAVSPTTNTKNEFSFSWDAPSDIGVTIDYYYFSVNQEPTEGNVTKVEATSLAEGPYATQQGTNTFYVVAVDDAGNYDLDNFASVDFSATTTAPGIPTSMSITDSSDRANQLYRLTVAWNTPVDGDVDHYDIYRSTTGSDFSQIAQTASTIYAETGLDTDTTYYYFVVAVDNAGAISASSTTVDKQPTGRYPDPPTYTSDPEVEVSSSTARITWTTNRESTTFVVYGTDNNLGFSNGSLDNVSAHEILLTGLAPSTIYYYRLQSFDDARDYSLTDALSELHTFTTSVAPAISEVTIDDVRQTTAIVTWKTTTVSSTQVKYGKTNAYGNQITDQSTGATTVHTVRLTELDAESLYHVKISGADIEGNVLESDDYVFQTLAFPRIFNVTFEPVADASSATIKVAWETNVDTDSIVEYRSQGGTFVESVTSELLTDHELVVPNLLDNTIYEFRAKGRDQYGNVATSDLQIYSTPFDTRPPKISDIVVETAILGSGQEATAQIIVSWKTDENATSQVEYGEGVGGTTYTNKTVEDGVLTNSHVVIISDVVPSKPYHLRVVSRDAAINEAASSDYAVITGRATDSVLDLIIFNLQETFGWIGGLINL
ncbi:fibronectin type III domain-containing protein [candidate division WWE3 bacterium]|uniref:Fibronectin type III domain-containing protein n=1 Tax=candidate division WWE3 bacterium TaxID=2053526 RepID=A0A955LJW6_UNCKA|nr:fibronectin type III domain-containing protein [candidate division WWE3 bacterium]